MEIGINDYIQQAQDVQQDTQTGILRHQQQYEDYERELAGDKEEQLQEKSEIQNIADIGALELGKVGLDSLKKAGQTVMKNKLRELGVPEADLQDLSRGDLKTLLKRKIGEAKDNLKNKLNNQGDERVNHHRSLNQEVDDALSDKEEDEPEEPKANDEANPVSEENIPVEDDFSGVDLNMPTQEGLDSSLNNISSTVERNVTQDLPEMDESEGFLSGIGKRVLGLLKFNKKNTLTDEPDEFSTGTETTGLGDASNPLEISDEAEQYFSGNYKDSLDFMNNFSREKGLLRNQIEKAKEPIPESDEDFFTRQAEQELRETTEDEPITDDDLLKLRDSIRNKTSEPSLPTDEDSLDRQLTGEWNRNGNLDKFDPPPEPEPPEVPSFSAQESQLPRQVLPEPDFENLPSGLGERFPQPEPSQVATPPEQTQPQPKEQTVQDEDVKGGEKSEVDTEASEDQTKIDTEKFIDANPEDPSDAGGSFGEGFEKGLEEGLPEAEDEDLAGGGIADPYSDALAGLTELAFGIGGGIASAFANPQVKKPKPPPPVQITAIENPSTQFGY